MMGMSVRCRAKTGTVTLGTTGRGVWNGEEQCI